MNKKRLIITIVIVVVVVATTILFDILLANHLPAITSLEAEPERVLPSGSCQIVCTASDNDGDQLSYNWSASAGEINGEGDTVTWTAPRSEGSYNITVTVTDGRGGEVTDYVIIEVRANRSPTITNLVADADWATPSGSIQVTCTASDRDGDELNYEWSTDGGNVTGTGAVVNWIAPAEVGIYYVTVVVTDGHGMEGTWPSLPLSVVTDTPPIIEGLIVTAEHKYLKTTTYGYMIGETKEYLIECSVSDPSVGVVYDWSCDGGEISEISEDGSMITWTAPATKNAYFTVTVIVSDVANNRVAKRTVLYVVSCSACTFR
jgi:hypothetical protein